MLVRTWECDLIIGDSESLKHAWKKCGIWESHSWEILVNKIKKYIKNGGKFFHSEGKFYTIFPGNVAFFPAVLKGCDIWWQRWDLQNWSHFKSLL